MSQRPEFQAVEEQIALLLRGVVEVVTENELRGKLEKSRATGRALVVKVGFDPTAPDIHLGHTVLLRKMRSFQDLGHRVIFVIGDFTGSIGDPTGRSDTRPALTAEQITANAETYRKQCYRILDPVKTEIRFNSEWLAKLGSEGFVRLAARYNVARMLERKDFKKRYQAGESIALHEFLYPLAQAYDSVHLEADVELGGTDQLFNLNVGRDIMPAYGLEPQVVMTTPLLEGLDGVQKMSKSLDNYIGITEPPREIFGKVMSISDDLMWRYYELCTSLSAAGIEDLKEIVRTGQLHPKRAKEGLAMRIVTDFHDESAARDALGEFRRVFEEHGLPDEVPERTLAAGDGRLSLSKMLVELGLAASNSDALRLVRQGGVRIDDRKVDPGAREITVCPGETRLIKVGKRRFARVTFS